MPAPKDPVKLAEYKRKHSEIMKRNLADPEIRAKMFAWKSDPERFWEIQAKAHLWQNDPVRVRIATEKRKQNPNYIKAMVKNHAEFTEKVKRLSPEALSARGKFASDPALVKRLAQKIWADPILRTQRIAILRSPEARAKYSGERNPAKRPEVRLKISQAKKGKSLNGASDWSWTDARRKKMRDLALNNPRLSSGTKIELALREGLNRAGVQFEANKPILGVCVPDLVIRDAKIAVFADGCYFHGCRLHCKWLNDEIPLGRRQRDEKINHVLLVNGWLPLRFWEHEIKKNLDSIVEQIVSCYSERRAMLEANDNANGAVNSEAVIVGSFQLSLGV